MFPSDEELDRAEVEAGGLAAFVRLAWDQVCPESFVPNWHIDEIVKLLEQITHDRKNEISNELAVCVPPSSSKSKIVSVLWQPWVWTWWPESSWITSTYEQELASDLSSESLALVQSDWYQARWPLKVIKDAAKHWKNDRGGERRAVGTGGAITGKHAHFHVGDDLIKEQKSWRGSIASIVAAMQEAKQFWFGTMITRKKGQAIARVLVGQRLHIDDPPGVAIREHGYQSVVFPLRYSTKIADPRDPRTTDGELLCEARCDLEGVKALEASMTPSAARAQLDQDPVPPGGYLIRPEYLEHRYSHLPSSMQRSLESGRAAPGEIWSIYADLTFKGKSTSDFVVFQLWCRRQGLYYLIDQIRGQWGFRETKQRAKEFADRYRVASACKLEDAANAAAMEEDMKGEIRGLISIPHGGGCLARVQQVEGTWASGCVMLPESADWLGGSDGFVAEHLSYDGLGTRHDDQVSAASLALLDLSAGSASAYAEILKGLK